jgi:DinB superfamily
MVRYELLDCEALADHVRRDLAEVESRFAPLLPDQLRWSPAPSRWCVGQCLHHLVVCDAGYLDRLEPALARARARGLRGSGPYTGGLVGRWFAAQVGPFVARRAKAPRSLTPAQSADVPEDVVDAFLRRGRRLLDVIDATEGLDLDAIRIGFPLAPIMRLRVIDALRGVVAHDRRHLNQACRVAEEPAFPGRALSPG